MRCRSSSRTRRAKGLAIGLTGGIACGKSEVARVLERLGAAVADADIYARAAVRPGTVAYNRVVRLFGTEIVRPDRTIDRRSVARMVARNADMRLKLERIIHPVVIRRLRAWVKKMVERGRVAVAVVPLLYEVGLTDLWDSVICVVAPKHLVLDRLAARGMNRSEAEAWLRAQMPMREKARRADYVIRNEGTLKELERQVKRVWKTVVKRGVGGS